MKSRVLAAFIFIIPVGLFLLFWLIPGIVKMPSEGEKKVSQDAAVNKALSRATQANAVISSNFAAPPQSIYYSATSNHPVTPAGKATPLEITNIAPQIVLENMRRTIHQYGAMFGGNPVGNNSEITSQLRGDNPKHINFLNSDAGMRVNASGELIDPWGTPYFFHQLSGTDMEIHSAGPDRIMWTADDLVISE